MGMVALLAVLLLQSLQPQGNGASFLCSDKKTRLKKTRRSPATRLLPLLCLCCSTAGQLCWSNRRAAACLFLDQFYEGAESAFGVDEGYGCVAGAGAGGGVYGGGAGGDHGFQSFGAVVYPVADMVQTGAALFQKLGYGRVGAGGGCELDIGIGDLQQSFFHAVALHDFPMSDLSPESPLIKPDSLIQVVNRNSNMVDFR